MDIYINSAVVSAGLTMLTIVSQQLVSTGLTIVSQQLVSTGLTNLTTVKSAMCIYRADYANYNKSAACIYRLTVLPIVSQQLVSTGLTMFTIISQ